jgi:hypothetical protein
MAAKLRLVFMGKKQSFSEPLRARIVLGDHFINDKDERLLTSDCATASELEAEVDFLKSQLDKFVRVTQKKFITKPAKK